MNRQFVLDWSQRYMAASSKAVAAEVELLEEVGWAVRRRGHYTKPELIRVGDWKAARNRSRLAQNSSDDVEHITRMALAAPEHLQHRYLSVLHGVGAPMASALLTVWVPERNTVLDYRAVGALEALERNGALPESVPPRRGAYPDYRAYVDCCLAIASRLAVSLRDLDRALWKWHEQDMP
jgi:hypothetical protein